MVSRETGAENSYDGLVVFRLAHLEQMENDMANEVRDVLVERRRGRRRVGSPFRRLRELVESTDDLKGRVARRLAKTTCECSRSSAS